MADLNYSIVACKLEKNNAIGFKGGLLYHLPYELEHFQALTIGDNYHRDGPKNVVVMGYNTFKSLNNRPLKHRVNIVVTREHVSEIDAIAKERAFRNKKVDPDLYSLSDLNDLPTFLKKINNRILNDVFVIGGGQLYKSAFKCGLCKKLYITDILGSVPNFEYDTFFPQVPMRYELKSESAVQAERGVKFKPSGVSVPRVRYIYREYTIAVDHKLENKEELAYLNLLKEALQAPLRSTRNAKTRAVFANTLSFDLSKGFPLLTSKRMPVKSKVIEKELLFFLRGQTDNEILRAQDVHIWDGNTTSEFLQSNGKCLEEHDLGPMYGHQFRHFGATYRGCKADYSGEGIDQLETLIEGIKSSPHARRHIMTSLNVSQVELGCLWPCHSLIIQCFVRGPSLDMLMHQRSADLFLGLPFNVASNAILLKLLAQRCALTPGKLTINIGDAHIYENHMQQVQAQIKRVPFPFPTYTITKQKRLSDYSLEDFNLDVSTYKCHPPIKAKMTA